MKFPVEVSAFPLNAADTSPDGVKLPVDVSSTPLNLAEISPDGVKLPVEENDVPLNAAETVPYGVYDALTWSEKAKSPRPVMSPNSIQFVPSNTNSLLL